MTGGRGARGDCTKPSISLQTSDEARHTHHLPQQPHDDMLASTYSGCKYNSRLHKSCTRKPAGLMSKPKNYRDAEGSHVHEQDSVSSMRCC